MKKILKSAPLISLMLIILSVVLISCGKNDSGNSNNSQNDGESQNQNAQDNPENTETQKITYEIPDMDFEGYDFKALCREGWTIYWYCVDVFAEAENGEPINDAVYKRNRILEDNFNITISEIRQSDVAGFAGKLIKSGSDDFDVMFPTLAGAGGMIQQGYLLNLYNVPYLDFDKPWWNKTTNDSLTCGHKLYAGVGSITTMTNDATWVCLFNKEIVRDLGLPDHYQVVKDGKWTIDVLHQNARKATKDLNGDGEMTPEDQWGAIGQYESAYCLFGASGQFIVEKDETDYPSLVLNNDRSVYAVDKIINLMTDKTCYINADDYTGKYENVWIEITTNAFAESRCLYLITNVEIVKNLRGMETNFGILPLPKTDETQEKYYNTMQYGNASCVALPITASNLERTGTVVEAWAAESVDTLTKAYYDINLKTKNARDNESEDMLDLIFSTRVIDQAMFFNWAGLYDFFTGFVKAQKVEFASQYEKSEPKWLKAIEKTIEAIEENN